MVVACSIFLLTPSERSTPLVCRSLTSAFDWTKLEAPGKVHANLASANTETVMVRLPRGKHLLRTVVDRGFFNSVAFRSKTELKVGLAHEILGAQEGL